MRLSWRISYLLTTDSTVKEVIAFKVSNTTYNATVGTSFTVPGTGFPQNQVNRPITRLTDNYFMVDARDSVSVLNVDASLVITEVSTETTSNQDNTEVEFFNDAGTVAMRRQDNSARVLEG